MKSAHLKAAAGLAVLLTLSACTNRPGDGPGFLGLGSDNIPETTNPAIRKTGDYPKIGNVPSGATAQLTSAEKAQIKSGLQSSAVPAATVKQAAATEIQYRQKVASWQKAAAKQAPNKKAAAKAEEQYRKKVAALQGKAEREAAERRKKLAEIE